MAPNDEEKDRIDLKEAFDEGFKRKKAKDTETLLGFAGLAFTFAVIFFNAHNIASQSSGGMVNFIPPFPEIQGILITDNQKLKIDSGQKILGIITSRGGIINIHHTIAASALSDKIITGIFIRITFSIAVYVFAGSILSLIMMKSGDKLNEVGNRIKNLLRKNKDSSDDSTDPQIDTRDRTLGILNPKVILNSRPVKKIL